MLRYYRCERSARVGLSRRCLLRLGDLLRVFFVLVVVPRTYSGVDEASEEEEKADKQYDPDHATIKSVSFAQAGNLAHKRFLVVYPTEGDTHIKAYCEGMVNSSLCKIASVVLSIYVMEINIIICMNNEITIKNHEKSNK